MAAARSRNLPSASSVEMQVHAVRAEFLDRRQERHIGARLACVIELPRAVLRLELLRHAPDRRNADAAGKQNDLGGILDQWEIVARRADLQSVSGAQIIKNVARTAAACCVKLDGNDVALGIVVRVEQRKLTDEPIGQMDVDMSTRLVGRQPPAVGPPERIDIGVARDRLDGAELHVDQSSGVRRFRPAYWRGRGCSHRVHEVINRQAGWPFATASFSPCNGG